MNSLGARPDPAAERSLLDRVFRKGRHDEPAQVDLRDAAAREAYDRGRRDERARRRPAPLLTLALLAAAAVGVGAVSLAVREGSFAKGGAVVDARLAGVAAQASWAAQMAVDKTGDALEGAGARLKRPQSQQAQNKPSPSQPPPG